MGEVTLELLAKLVLEVQAEQKAMRAEMQAGFAALNESARALARADVAIQRDLRAVKDRVTILTVAFGDEPPLHT